jgi:hypothetical protein
VVVELLLIVELMVREEDTTEIREPRFTCYKFIFYTRCFRDFKIPPFDSSNLHLLPWEIQGFELASKSWTSFNVEEIKEVVFDDKAWDHLVLEEEVKVRELHSLKYLLSIHLVGHRY